MNADEILTKMPFLKVREGGRDGIAAFDCPPQNLKEAVSVLKSDFLFDSLCDIASVDMGENSPRRFGCVYHFYSMKGKSYLRLASFAESAETPKLQSISDIFANANWFEREAFDMMGIVFEGHPDLRRILMWDKYEWHPLRKDFPLAGRESTLPDTYEDAVGDDPMFVKPAPMEGGPFHSEPGAKFAACKEPRSREQK